MVPRIAHVVRLGPKAYQPDHSNTLRELNPSWQVMEWNDGNVGELLHLPRELFDAAHEPAAKADLVRLAALLQFGGVYSDLDVQWLAPLDECMPLGGGFVCVAEDISPPVPNNAVMAADVGDPVVRALLEEARVRARVRLVPARWGPGMLMAVLPRFPEGVTVLPPSFAPNPSRARSLAMRGGAPAAIHHYGNSWFGGLVGISLPAVTAPRTEATTSSGCTTCS